MIIVADGGATKTDWALIGGRDVYYAESAGLNPHFLTDEQLSAILSGTLNSLGKKEQVKAVYFYGSGYGLEANRNKLHTCLQQMLPIATIYVGTDLEGAAAALFGKEKGVACILGTGANAGVYDGEKIVNTPKSLGYLLGDNGGGAALGLSLLRLYLHNKLPSDTAAALEKTHNVDYTYLLDSVYKKDRPNRFFASFAPFISAHRDCPAIRAMLTEQFDEFIRYFLCPFPESKIYPVRITGSIGYYFQEMLKEALQYYGMTVDKIERRPITFLAQRYLLVEEK